MKLVPQFDFFRVRPIMDSPRADARAVSVEIVTLTDPTLVIGVGATTEDAVRDAIKTTSKTVNELRVFEGWMRTEAAKRNEQ